MRPSLGIDPEDESSLHQHSGQLAKKWANEDWTQVLQLDQCLSVSAERIIVIGGCARSGTTLLRVMLDTHSQVVVGPPTNVLIPTELDLADIAFRLALEESIVARLAELAADRVLFVERLAKEVRRIYGKDRWGEKTARNIHRFRWVLKHFPEARVIHVLRDGRDVVCSLRRHRRREVVDGELRAVRNEMPLALCMARWMRAVEAGVALRGESRYMEIRYEDLTRSPARTMEAACDFLGVEFQPPMLDYHRVKSALRDPIRFPQNLEATLPLYAGAVGRWRKDLTAEEASTVNLTLADWLSALGYDR